MSGIGNALGPKYAGAIPVGSLKRGAVIGTNALTLQQIATGNIVSK